MKNIFILILSFVFYFSIFNVNTLFAQEQPRVTQETIKVGSKELKYKEEKTDYTSKAVITIPSSSLEEAYNVLKEYYDTNTNNSQDVYYKIGRLIEVFGQLNPVINNNDIIDMSFTRIVTHKSSNTELCFDIADSETNTKWSYTMKYVNNNTILTINHGYL